MTDTEDLFREGMARFTADVTVPAGLPARAAGHLRRRRTAVSAAAVSASAAAVTAIAVALTITGPGPVTRPQNAVLVRAEAALAAVSQENLIQETHTTYAVGETEVDWMYGSRDRLAAYGPDGHLLSDDGDRVAGNQEISTSVDYTHKTWYRWEVTIRAEPSAAPPPCAGVAPLAYNMLVPGPADWPAVFRTALSCGVYKVAGTETKDGERLIKLTPVHPQSPSTTYWIDAVTYLPVRAQLRYGDSTNDQVFQWLPPTAANLTNFDIPIPAGFTRVPPPK